MAATDAKPFPLKNTAYRVYFPILDADGDLVTGATGLDSEASLDGATFADCTNEATEVATSSGIYYLDLTTTEMNTDCTVIIVKTSSSGAKTTVLTLYPVDTGDIGVNVTAFGGTAGTFSGGRPEVNTSHIAGSAVSTSTAQIGVNVVNFGGAAGTFSSGRPEVNASHIAGSSVSTSAAQIGVNVVNAGGTAWGSGAITAGSIASDAITAAKIADGAIDAATFAAGAINAAAIAADAIGASELAADAVAEIADAVWDEVLSGHLTGGSTGNALNAAGSAGDPWSTALPGAYSAGSAGYIIGTNLDATVGTRATQTSVNTIDDFLDTEIAAIKAVTDQMAFGTANRLNVQVYGMEAGVVTAAAVATGAIDADALATDAVTEIANGILDLTDGVETGLTVRGALRLDTAALCGKLSGAAGTTATIRNVGDTKNRIVATVDSDGNRSAVTTDAT